MSCCETKVLEESSLLRINPLIIHIQCSKQLWKIMTQLLKRLKKHGNQAVEILVFSHFPFHLLSRVEDCGVMLAKLFANFWQRCLGELAAQIHCNLSWFSDPARIVLGLQFNDAQFEVFRHD